MDETADPGDSGGGETTGVEALRRLPEFSEPDGDRAVHGHDNDHLALLYGDREEQFAAVVPFVRQGLERGERCLYIADETDPAAVLGALRDDGIDVDEAVEAGALEVVSVDERNGADRAFDVETALSRVREAIDATGDGFEGVRLTGEETWVLEPGVPVDEFMQYESRLNELLERRDVTALCQYDRERFPPEILRDVIRTHPYVLDGTTVSRNVYYTPPGEFLGRDEPGAAVDRMVRTLRGEGGR